MRRIAVSTGLQWQQLMPPPSSSRSASTFRYHRHSRLRIVIVKFLRRRLREGLLGRRGRVLPLGVLRLADCEVLASVGAGCLDQREDDLKGWCHLTCLFLIDTSRRRHLLDAGKLPFLADSLSSLLANVNLLNRFEEIVIQNQFQRIPGQGWLALRVDLFLLVAIHEGHCSYHVQHLRRHNHPGLKFKNKIFQADKGLFCPEVLVLLLHKILLLTFSRGLILLVQFLLQCGSDVASALGNQGALCVLIAGCLALLLVNDKQCLAINLPGLRLLLALPDGLAQLHEIWDLGHLYGGVGAQRVHTQEHAHRRAPQLHRLLRHLLRRRPLAGVPGGVPLGLGRGLGCGLGRPLRVLLVLLVLHGVGKGLRGVVGRVHQRHGHVCTEARHVEVVHLGHVGHAFDVYGKVWYRGRLRRWLPTVWVYRHLRLLLGRPPQVKDFFSWILRQGTPRNPHILFQHIFKHRLRAW
mmetsp:Transcript_7851/g.16300  ORF Transcript_7851/g.16300 Transcript_7851/m.16300 type:complete len:465 (+) Transcript_7851:86-1480(+)